jgi:uncharacterized protein DUF2188
MARLPKFTLSHDQKRDDWKLQGDASNRVVKRFGTKADATAGGVLKKAVGSDGGSVRIEKLRGGYQKERTFPRSRDPRRSKG